MSFQTRVSVLIFTMGPVSIMATKKEADDSIRADVHSDGFVSAHFPFQL